MPYCCLFVYLMVTSPTDIYTYWHTLSLHDALPIYLIARQFGWFFIPMIGGMMLGAYTSGRMAARLSGARLAHIGFACCGVGAVANVAYNLFVPVPSIPWAGLPLSIGSFGLPLVFPILHLAMRSISPRPRGLAGVL